MWSDRLTAEVTCITQRRFVCRGHMADFPSVQGGADPTSGCWRMAGASAVELCQGELGKWNQLPASGYPSLSRFASVGDPSLKMSLPFGRRDLQLFPSCSASVAGIDADGGSPDGDFTKECGGRVAARWCLDQPRQVWLRRAGVPAVRRVERLRLVAERQLQADGSSLGGGHHTHAGAATEEHEDLVGQGERRDDQLGLRIRLDRGVVRALGAHVGDHDVYVGITSAPAVLPGMQQFDPERYADLSWTNPLPPEEQTCGNLPGEEGYDPRFSKVYENGLVWDLLTQTGRLLKSDSPRTRWARGPSRSSSPVSQKRERPPDVLPVLHAVGGPAQRETDLRRLLCRDSDNPVRHRDQPMRSAAGFRRLTAGVPEPAGSLGGHQLPV